MDSDEIDMETLLMTDDTLKAHIASSDRSPTTLSPAGKKRTESEIFSINESEAIWKLIGRLQSNLMQQSKLETHESILSVLDTPGFVKGVEELEHTINSLLDFATSHIFPLWLRPCVRYNFVQESLSHTTQNDFERLRFIQYKNSGPIKSAYSLVVDFPVPAFPLRNSELEPLYGICIHQIIHGFFHILPKNSKGTHEKRFLAIVHNINSWILGGGLGFTGIEVPLTCNFSGWFQRG